jgi:acyl-coenzyme A thioesterase PaaI-like protein
MTPLQHLAKLIPHDRFVHLMGLFPPYLGAGVRVRHVAHDLTRVEVALVLTRWNQNVMGTHFGGSLYAMCDPFLMVMIMLRLGPSFHVWDKGATIDFVRPGRGTVTVVFELSDERVEAIRREAESGKKVLPTFDLNVVDESGATIAHVQKILYVRKKREVKV